MDFKVYKKEDVKQPNGSDYLIVPDVVDLVPEEEDDVLVNFEIIDDSTTELEQQCSLAVIWQKGLDPLALSEGISWAQVMLEEVSIIQVMEELLNAVDNVTSDVRVVFDTVKASDGTEYFTFTLKGVQ